MTPFLIFFGATLVCGGLIWAAAWLAAKNDGREGF